jgi:hypothetical protein
MKFIKLFKESWADNILQQAESKYLASTKDEYFQMNLIDIDINGKDYLLTVELSDGHTKSKGYFKYKKSEIKGLTGDIIPVKMEGILDELWYENEEFVFDFINKLLDDLKIK